MALPVKDGRIKGTLMSNGSSEGWVKSLVESARHLTASYVGRRNGADGAGHASQIIQSTAEALVRASGSAVSLHDAKQKTGRLVTATRLPAEVVDWIIASDPSESSATPIELNKPGLRVTVSSLAIANDGAGAMPSLDEANDKGHILQGVLHRDRDQVWVLSLVRMGPTSRFHGHEVGLLARLMPLFSSLLRRELRTPAESSANAVVWEVLDQMAVGILLLDAEGRVVGCNQAASDLLSARDGIELRDGRLTLVRPREHQRLQQVLERLTRSRSASAQDQSEAIMIERPKEGLGVQMVITKLGEQEGLPPAHAGSLVAFLFDLAANDGPKEQWLRELYGLTRVEAEITKLICQGYSPAEVGHRLRVSVHTVRGYLKPIFYKVGVHRQTDLVRVIAAGSGLLRSRGGQTPRIEATSGAQESHEPIPFSPAENPEPDDSTPADAESAAGDFVKPPGAAE